MVSSVEKPVSVVVVGGGAAGWIAASVLARKLAIGTTGAAKITLIESPRRGIIGVGEATVPSIRMLLKFLGIKESEFINETQATFKQGILYRDWLEKPELGAGTSYFHPFDYMDILNLSPSHWWLAQRSDQSGAKYAEDICSQYRVAAAGKAPRLNDMPEYEGPLGYAYHVDAEALAEFLARRAVSEGVLRIFDEVLDTKLAPDGSISSLTTRNNGEVTGHFFVDCTGFNALIMSQGLGVGFESYADQLFCDRAVAFRVPTDDNSLIRPFTTASARDNGWIWDIDLQRRSGIGYVYSSRHISEEEAEKDLRAYVGSRADSLSARHLKMRVGRSSKFWHKNVAVIGLAGGFIEPLESTGLYLIETGAVQLGDLLLGTLGLAHTLEEEDETRRDIYLTALQSVEKIYNDRMIALYEEIRDFVKVHYYLTNRVDTKFWRDNKEASSASDQLKAKLEAWHTRPPQNFDFMNRLSFFNEHNWLYVMLGMKWRPPEMGALRPFTNLSMGHQLLSKTARDANNFLAALPDHRAYLQKNASLISLTAE